MLIKFENKSNRVKGLCFHHKRPWILAALHNGVIQLWDYLMGVMVEKFEEHDGPVRGIDFHCSQPLFVSGGDDYKIKVWNYTLRRCLFQLLGHTDYIRTVQFHFEAPQIVSASDDQTIRIQNQQNRTCLSILTGHNHYVMCAQFHPTDPDLVLSASLDESLRIQDVKALRKKKNVSTFSSFSAGNLLQEASPEIFGLNDVTVKHIVEGHSRGVNQATFHKSMPLIVSAADDREVKLQRYNDSRVWEVDTMRGHTNNVSCVIFHPKEELIISNSEDKSIRVQEISKQSRPQVLRRESDRYWILAAHPNKNLMASGHDNGFLIFKFERERPALDFCKDNLYYYLDNSIRKREGVSGRDDVLVQINQSALSARGSRKLSQSSGSSSQGVAGVDSNPLSLLYNFANSFDDCFLLVQKSNNSQSSTTPSNTDISLYYELYCSSNTNTNACDKNIPKRAYFGTCTSLAFVARNRFAVLPKHDSESQTLLLKDLTNEIKRKINLPESIRGSINSIFTAGLQRLILICLDGRIVLLDISQSRARILNELVIPDRTFVKYVRWSDSEKFRYCAMMTKYSIYIVDTNLNLLCSVNENRIKSGVWDVRNLVFVYSTPNHIKYCLPCGESGIIKSIDKPFYLAACSKDSNTLTVFDKNDSKLYSIPTSSFEYKFKTLLENRRYDQVLDTIRRYSKTAWVGESIISYLIKKDFAEGALWLGNQDPKAKFELAIECGNIPVAFECAKTVDQRDCQRRLATEALRYGLYSVVQTALIKTDDISRLSFLYFICGNIKGLKKLQNSLNTDAKSENFNFVSQFHLSLWLDDVEARVKTLKNCGHKKLALLTASTHNLTNLVDELSSELEEEDKKAVERELLKDDSVLLTLPSPIQPLNTDWPIKHVGKTMSFEAEKEGDGVLGNVDEYRSKESGNGSRNVDEQIDEEGLAPSPKEDENVKDVVSENDGDFFFDEEVNADNNFNEFSSVRGKPTSNSKVDKQSKAQTPTNGSDFGGICSMLEPGDEVADFEQHITTDEKDQFNFDSSDLAGTVVGSDSVFVPNEGKTYQQIWMSSIDESQSTTIGDLVASNSFDLAFEALNRKFGITKFEPLKPFFESISLSTSLKMNTLTSFLQISVPFQEKFSNNNPNMSKTQNSRPALCFTLDYCTQTLLKEAFSYFPDAFSSSGNIQNAIKLFLKPLYTSLFLRIESQQILEIENLINVCRDYILCLRVFEKRSSLEKECSEDEKKQSLKIVELACYCTQLNGLSKLHTCIMLLHAVKVSNKFKDFRVVIILCRRLLELALSTQLPKQISRHIPHVKQILAKAEKQNCDYHEDLNVDLRASLNLCSASFCRIADKDARIRVCRFCKSKYLGNDQICKNCLIGTTD